MRGQSSCQDRDEQVRFEFKEHLATEDDAREAMVETVSQERHHRLDAARECFLSRAQSDSNCVSCWSSASCASTATRQDKQEKATRTVKARTMI